MIDLEKLLKFFGYKTNGTFSDAVDVKRMVVYFNINYGWKINKELIILI